VAAVAWALALLGVLTQQWAAAIGDFGIAAVLTFVAWRVNARHHAR
jgi:hypothetical protein